MVYKQDFQLIVPFFLVGLFLFFPFLFFFSWRPGQPGPLSTFRRRRPDPDQNRFPFPFFIFRGRWGGAGGQPARGAGAAAQPGGDVRGQPQDTNKASLEVDVVGQM